MKEKPVHHHIREYDLALRVLSNVGLHNSQEGKAILKRLKTPADRARAKALLPEKSSSEKDWHKARDAADAALSLYVRFRDTRGGPTLAERIGACITCEKPKRGNELQCGHWLSRKYFGTRWHEFNVGAQCAHDNSPHGGHGKPVEFEAAIKLIHGTEWPDKLRAKSKFNSRKPSIMELNRITEEFTSKLERLKIRESNG